MHVHDPLLWDDIRKVVAGCLGLAVAGGLLSALVRTACERAWRGSEQRAGARIAGPRERDGWPTA
jgi:hypothetical protein